MDATYVHLVLNHIPILGSIFGVLLLIIGMFIRNQTLEVTGVATLLLACAMTIPVYLSGEEAEHVVEAYPQVSEHELEEHEEHAELSLWLMMVTGVSALLTLVAYQRTPQLRSKARLATAILGGLAFITLIPLANHGGKIIRPELRNDHPEEGEAHEAHHDADEVHHDDD